ncbi:MAG: 7-carboxy-7-deazaguanine synthase QueE, partial [Dehalococcoidia bacterium]|nr:7-carboxy-7-deazaguanine synthase QueE [Dehalococcoidia bacterium]
MLRISRLPDGEPEIFASIQGEGVTCGLPSVFVRLALCNLRCVWCDTAYTWDWRRYDPLREVIALPTAEVERRVLAAAKAAGAVTNVVVTGGEPLIQQVALGPLVRALKLAGMRVEVETNGTLVPDTGLTAVDQWNVSPKLANSSNDVAARHVETALRWYAETPHAFFKFVLVAPEDLEEVLGLVRRLALPADRVIL